MSPDRTTRLTRGACGRHKGTPRVAGDRFRTWLLFSGCLLLCALSHGAAHADEGTDGGRLQGRLLDERGGLPARLTARNLSSGFVAEETSDETGHFGFPDLPPGAYELTIRKGGIATGRLWVLLFAHTTTSLEATPDGEGIRGVWPIRHFVTPSLEGELGRGPDVGPPTPPPEREVSEAVAPEQEESTAIPLVLKAGTPLRVALDERVRLGRVGQAVLGTLVDAVYAFDRVVLPAGTKVIGHVEKFEPVKGRARLQAILGGDLTPLRRAVLRFDTLMLADCTEIPIATEVGEGVENVSVETAGGSAKAGKVGQVREQLAQRMEQAVAPLRGEDRMERLKEMLTSRLPYHAQYLHRGTVFQAELLSPLTFGEVRPVEWAPPGTAAPPESVLRARLLTPLDSARTPRGTPIRAVLTQPLLSADERLLLPEGSELQGEVTFAKGAGKFHHNGQLRFLFESVQLPGQGPRKLLASLYSVELGRDEQVSVDEEGGASISNSKSRFIAPAVALLAVRASLHREGPDADDIGRTELRVRRGGVGSRGVGGYFGLGLLGAGLSQVSRPVALALGFVGLARTAYGAIFGKGREVTLPTSTPIQLQLSPASAGP